MKNLWVLFPGDSYLSKASNSHYSQELDKHFNEDWELSIEQAYEDLPDLNVFANADLIREAVRSRMKEKFWAITVVDRDIIFPKW